MSAAQQSIDSAIREVGEARARVTRSHSVQVRAADEIDYLKTVAYSWFRTHCPELVDQPGVVLDDATKHYTALLSATGRLSARSTYSAVLKSAKAALIVIRTQLVTSPRPSATPDAAPDFSALASDQTMKDILIRRWKECQICTKAGAHLAATVMMGGLLEALFVARANKMTDKSPLFTAASTPRHPKTAKPMPLPDWTLQPYIDVAHELGWITKSGKDVAAVLRDYRNYIHPDKERRHGIVLTAHDSRMFWEVTKLLATQLLR